MRSRDCGSDSQGRVCGGEKGLRLEMRAPLKNRILVFEACQFCGRERIQRSACVCAVGEVAVCDMCTHRSVGCPGVLSGLHLPYLCVLPALMLMMRTPTTGPVPKG
jgi:hypothetical protein